jgi:hypothetical protein
MAHDAFAWLSITVKQGLKLLQPPKIMKCKWEDSFGEVLGQAREDFVEKLKEVFLYPTMTVSRIPKRLLLMPL